ncbi:hypothetical protein BGZ82_000167 [Podila clonocystis]|nr:hypothetical protein BGZ82_000167 [Podila clonocystis]
MEAVSFEAREKLVLPEFMLEIPTLEEQNLANVPHVQCPMFDAHKSETFVQALVCLPWCVLQSAVLTGENIGGWLDFLAKVEALRLKRLKIDGSKSAQQQEKRPATHLCRHTIVELGR